ncbi:MAG: cytochrome c biogenesis protein ResB [Actinobacteria bacterium]|nr:cytochrome c biogenesis protein ResB [Actinomycetota bacterium]
MSIDLETPTAREPGGPPPLDTAGFLRWCWRQLTSMRIALILLFLLAIASIPGTVLPQRGLDPIRVTDWIEGNPTWGPLLDRLGFFDVYAAPWFAAIYLLLFISVIGCVIPRTRIHWRAMRATPPPPPRFLDRMPGFRTWTTCAREAEVLDKAEADLRARRWRVDRGPCWVAAEKGYLRETGNLLFHAALIALLVSIAYGALFGWRGNVIVREGTGFSDTLTQYDAWGGGRLVSPDNLPPFSFTLDDFRVDFERSAAQRGAPRMFEADLSVRPEPGAPTEAVMVRVNEPFSVDGAKVFLVGHGYAPVLELRDALGRVVHQDGVVFLPQDGNFTSTGVLKSPDATPSLGFQGLFLPTAAVDDVRGPHSIFPAPDDPAVFLSAWAGDLGLDSGVPQSVYALKTEGMTQLGLEALRPGQSWDLPGGNGTIAFVGLERWASFQIAHDPGKEPALISAMVALLGLMMSLFIRRRRVWVRVADEGAGVTLVTTAGLMRSDEGEVSEDVDAAAQALGERTLA